MKYFNDITSKEELKKQFREYCVTMHPDKGGNAEEFKVMVAEYETINKDFDRIKEQQKQEEEARKAAEEYRKAEEERKRKEEEEARKAAEALREVIGKWSGILEAVTPEGSWYHVPSTKYAAAVKRNIKKILEAYFPGVVFSVSLKNERYKESACISWIDGPTAEQVENVKELRYFVSHYHVCDPYEDYGHDEECKSTRAWRDKFGQIIADDFDFNRTFSKLGKAEVLGNIYKILPQFKGMTNNSDSAYISSDDVFSVEKFFGFWYDWKGRNWQELSEEERDEANAFDNDHLLNRKDCDKLNSREWYSEKTELRTVLGVFLKYYTISDKTTKAAAEAAAVPVFIPKHNKSWQAIKKALGSNTFGIEVYYDKGGYDYKEVSFFKAAELVGAGETVLILKPACYRGERCFYTVNLGGAKVQQKRAEKFAAVGVEVLNTGWNSYKDVVILGFTRKIYDALKQDAEDVEKQRKAWKEEQQKGKQTAHKTAQRAKSSTTAANPSTDTNEAPVAQDAADEAPADGLELVEIADGVAVVGDSRTTYRNRKAIKAHGATWNKEAQQWQATDAEAVARLRQWFFVAEPSATVSEQTEETTTAAASDKQATEAAINEQQPAEQPTANTAQADTLHSAEEITDTDRASLSALSGLAFALRSVASSILSAFEDWITDDLHAKNLRQSIAQDLEEIKKLNERVRKMSEELEAVNARQEQRAGRTDAAASNKQTQAEEPTAQTVQTSQATATDTQADQPAQDGGKADRLEMLQAAAEDVERLTNANEHGRAALAELYTLCACGVDVRDLIDEVREINADETQNREPAPSIWAKRSEVRRSAQNRAKVVLSTEEFAALYASCTSSSSPKAA